MNKYSIGDYIISQYNRKGNNVFSVYAVPPNKAYEYFFSILPGEEYPACMQNVNNLVKVTSIIISTWSNKRLFSGVLYNNKIDAGKDDRTHTIIRTLVDAVLTEKKYEIDTLYNTTILEYNPIENYNSTETETTQISGSEIDTISGSEIDTKSGSEIDTISGSEIDTKSGSEIDTKSGSETHSRTGNDSTTYTGGTTTTPTGSTSVTRKETAFNEPSDLATSSQDVTSYDGMSTLEVFNDRADTNSHAETETATYNNLQNEHTFNDRKNEHTFNDRKNEHMFNDRKNEHTFNDRKNERTFERKGNIGVTTSQQMLEQERNIALFSVWQHIANIVQESITTSEWLAPDRKECDYDY